MLKQIIIAYIIGCVLAWFYGGFQTGLEFAKAKRMGVKGVSINWLNIFYQGLAWVGYVGTLVGEWIGGRNNPPRAD